MVQVLPLSAGYVTYTWQHGPIASNLQHVSSSRSSYSYITHVQYTAEAILSLAHGEQVRRIHCIASSLICATGGR
jgi:hypothetical protein